ncbi:hypothetical protein FO519_004551 [Halicephalobus sp. NKZ332]|nr:hypothetical protein FO519_004551 [Halicephalobus sp. NKZ332]
MNGANDVEITGPIWSRIDKNQSWTFEDLNLFQQKERNLVGFNGKEPKLDFAKGYVECSLSRAMAEFMVFDLNLTTALTLINKKGFGIDEILIPTLVATDALNAPGGFTHYCIEKHAKIRQLTRLSIWYSLKNCHSGKMRHAICIFGVSDLKHLRDYPHLFGNKLMTEVDFLASVCWREFLFNKTYVNPIVNPADELNQTVYTNAPAVRYNQQRYDPNFNISNFDCKLR